jgi:uncharacterized protein YaiI (UPF0178 family)
MYIWVDADACPRPIKEILYRAAIRTHLPLTLVSNLSLRTPKSEYIKTVQVPGGFDVADEHIIEMIKAGDLVITADIPLAAAVVEAGAVALNPRGKLYTKENIGEALTMRNVKDELRNAGIETGGPSAFKPADREAFANQLDRLLSKDS